MAVIPYSIHRPQNFGFLQYRGNRPAILALYLLLAWLPAAPAARLPSPAPLQALDASTNVDSAGFKTFFDWLEEAYENDEEGAFDDERVKRHLDAFEGRLKEIRKGKHAIPLVTMLDEKGKVIKDPSHSRAYLVSQGYSMLMEFAGDVLEDDELAVKYGREGMAISPLNPDVAFLTAFYEKDYAWEARTDEKVLRLTRVSEHLLDRDRNAVFDNWGNSVWNADLKARYPEAIRALRRAYYQGGYENAAGSLAGLYLEIGKLGKAFDILKREAIGFFDSDDEYLANQPNSYWYMVRRMIDTAQELGDKKATSYFCGKYQQLNDEAYENCPQPNHSGGLLSTLLSRPSPKSPSASNLTSFWRLKTDEKAALKTILDEDARMAAALATALLDKKDLRLYQDYSRAIKTDPDKFAQQHAKEFEGLDEWPFAPKMQPRIDALFILLRSRGYLASIDWKDSEEKVVSFVTQTLKKRFHKEMDPAYYEDFRHNYAYDTVEPGDRIFDLLAFVSYQLGKTGYGLVQLNMGDDAYHILVVNKKQMKKLEALAGIGWTVVFIPKHMVYPRKGGGVFVH